ncbi:MAG: hypothetical protein ABWK05_04920 [Pyrobaculum sp.]
MLINLASPPTLHILQTVVIYVSIPVLLLALHVLLTALVYVASGRAAALAFFFVGGLLLLAFYDQLLNILRDFYRTYIFSMMFSLLGPLLIYVTIAVLLMMPLFDKEGVDNHVDRR